MARSLLLLLWAGCAASSAEAPAAHETPAARAEPAPPPAEVAPSPAPVATDGLPRNQLLAVLDQSPGAFLQHVEVTPRFSGGRFAGWRMVRFFPGDERFAGVDLQAGDVVRTVNGLPVEKPEQLMVVWQALRTAPALEVELERNGSPHPLRWPIHD